jgi:hypothetical protein
VAPGSLELHCVRRDVLSWPNFFAVDAANHTIPECEALKENTVRRILKDPAHIEKDSKHPFPMERRKRPRKDALPEYHKRARRDYCLVFVSHDLMVIGVDECCIGFRGASTCGVRCRGAQRVTSTPSQFLRRGSH